MDIIKSTLGISHYIFLLKKSNDLRSGIGRNWGRAAVSPLMSGKSEGPTIYDLKFLLRKLGQGPNYTK